MRGAGSHYVAGPLVDVTKAVEWLIKGLTGWDKLVSPYAERTLVPHPDPLLAGGGLHYAFSVIPMLRALPSMIFIAASIVVALRSAILV
jgi:hypothetical protein